MYLNIWLGKISLFTIIALSSTCFGGEIYSNLPKQIDKNGKYVFYLHGSIVEGDNPRPFYSKFGFYEYEEIKSKLADHSEFYLIAHHRPAKTDAIEYSEKLESWVITLINSGVNPKNITLVGFSKGGIITLYASSQLNKYAINTVVLASCTDSWINKEESINLAGNFLSVYETTDVPGSCKALANRSGKLNSFKEIAISTGKGHGAFWKPLPEWITPLKKWISFVMQN